MIEYILAYIFLATLGSVAIVACGAWWLFLALMAKKWLTNNWP